MNTVDKHSHALDGCLWRDAMSQICNVSLLAEFLNHCFDECRQFILKNIRITIRSLCTIDSKKQIVLTHRWLVHIFWMQISLQRNIRPDLLSRLDRIDTPVEANHFVSELRLLG